jgi:hypothetical protein
VTLGMFQIVAKAQREDAYALQPLLPQLLQQLNTMVCTPYDEVWIPFDACFSVSNKIDEERRLVDSQPQRADALY